MLNSLQVLRGVAAWMIVFYHIQVWYFIDKTDHLFSSLIEKFGSYGVDFFFVLSGVVMALVSRRYLEKGRVFLVNRAFRVIPAYWFYTLLQVASIVVLPVGVYITGWDGASLLKSLLFIPHLSNSGFGVYPVLLVGWTLIYEMFFYLVFFFMLALKIPKPSISCSIVLILIAIFFRENNFLGYSSWLLIEFSIGIWIFEYFELVKNKLSLLTKFLPILAFVILLLLSVFVIDVLSFNFIVAGLVVYLFVILEPLFSKELNINRFFKILGDYSYSTYLSHIIVIGWFYYFFQDIESSMLNFIVILVLLITVFVVSSLTHHWVEKNKYILRLKGHITKLLLESSK